MKKDMKKLLVIVMALMPSLSILAMNPSGLDFMPEPDDIPITPMPDPFPGHEPRIQSILGTDENDNDGGPIDLGLGGVHPRNRQDIDPNLIPVTPHPSPNPYPGHEPRIRSVVQELECYHYDGVVYIYADHSITYINASVTRYDDNQIWSNAGSGNTLSITASDAPGEYYLELTLSSGQSYIGKYIIE